MNSTLMLAQQTAENVKITARKEAELILQEASNKKKQMMNETTMSLQSSQQELDKVVAQTRAFREKCRAILTSQLRLLDDMALDSKKDDDAAVKPVEEPPAEDAKAEE